MDREKVRRRYLPHWDVPGAAYFVTTCLFESIPAKGLLEIAEHRRELRQQPRPKEVTANDWNSRCWKMNFMRIEEWLDRRAANRVLEAPELSQIVVDAIRFFAGERYDLYAYVVMPSHFHWLFRPRPSWIESLADDGRTPRERITYSVNRFTSMRCNKRLNKKGPFWQKESFDHWARDIEEMERIIRYIEENPVKAGLVASPDEWLFSSASLRKALGLEWGVPLLGAKPRLES